MIILEKLKSTYGMFVQSDHGFFSKHPRRLRRLNRRSGAESPVDGDQNCKDENNQEFFDDCTYLCKIIKAFIEKSSEVEKNKTPEKYSELSECNTKTADTGLVILNLKKKDERKADDSLGDLVNNSTIQTINNNKKKNSMNTQLYDKATNEQGCEHNTKDNTDSESCINLDDKQNDDVINLDNNNDKLTNNKENNHSKIGFNSQIKKVSDNTTPSLSNRFISVNKNKSSTNTTTTNNRLDMFEKREYKLFNKNYTHIHRPKINPCRTDEYVFG